MYLCYSTMLSSVYLKNYEREEPISRWGQVPSPSTIIDFQGKANILQGWGWGGEGGMPLLKKT